MKTIVLSLILGIAQANLMSMIKVFKKIKYFLKINFHFSEYTKPNATRPAEVIQSVEPHKNAPGPGRVKSVKKSGPGPVLEFAIDF